MHNASNLFYPEIYPYNYLHCQASGYLNAFIPNVLKVLDSGKLCHNSLANIAILLISVGILYKDGIHLVDAIQNLPEVSD